MKSGWILTGDAPFEESEEKVLLEHFCTIFDQVLDSPASCLWVRICKITAL